MTDLTSRLVSLMESLGFSQVKDSTKKHLRFKLETELAGSIGILSDDKGRLLLYPDCQTMSELAKTTYSLKMELHHARAIEAGYSVKKVALQLRNEIKKQDISQWWPPDKEQDENIIPESVTQFLQTLLTGDFKCTKPSEKVKRLATSFGSDLVFAVTAGNVKPAKHILLPFAVKS
ncbi:unnamed protein product [Pleuronectes platessa]|uniref:Uncharacterized protein n=1 Tax=Pleuronectes platessa TaxID=8262 RepID=A0A9N7YD13_PLEPL|nr:unnamed protein product [Pleuronectes platessa]